MTRRMIPPCHEGQEVVRKITSLLGGQTEVAKILGIKQQSVWQWGLTGRIPVEHLEILSRETGFSPAEIRPDLDSILIKEPITIVK